ncbi:MAG: diguanylate cyclase domain-containing protein [Candidatus Brocadiales bacterium]
MRKDEHKTKKQLIEELESLRKQITEHNALETKRKRVEEELKKKEALASSVMDNITDMLMVVNPQDYKIVAVNKAYLDKEDFPREEIANKTCYEVTHKRSDPCPEDICPLLETVKTGKVAKAEHNHYDKDGNEYYAEVTTAPLFDEEKKLLYVLNVSRDITRRKRAEEALAKRAHLAALGADVGVALTKGVTLRTMLQQCTVAMAQHLDAAFARIWTLNKEEHVLELQASAGMYTHLDGPHSRVPVGKLKIGVIVQERKPFLTNDVVNEPWISDREWAKREGMAAFAGHPLIVEDRLVGVMAMFAREPLAEYTIEALASVADEIAVGIERKQAEETIQQMAYYDAVTALPNRTLFSDRLNMELAHAHRNRQMLALLFLDLDRFKVINDTLGHTIGDRLLKGVAGRLKNCVRGEDTVARMGGDEFTLILPGIVHVDDVTKVASKILESVKKPLMLDDYELNITISIGITIYPNDGEDAEILLRNADIAMYRAKEKGRDNYQYYT